MTPMMSKTMIIQGRTITSDDIKFIGRLLNENHSWHRTRLSKELCKIWNWRNLKGRYKDMACRTLLLKLEKTGHISLPPRRTSSGGNSLNRRIQYVSHDAFPINTDLKNIAPIQIETVRDTKTRSLFNCLFHATITLATGE